MAIQIISANSVGDCNNTSAGSISFTFSSNFYPVEFTLNSAPLNYSGVTATTFYSNYNTYSITGLSAGFYTFNLFTAEPNYPPLSATTVVTGSPTSFLLSFLVSSSSTISLNVTSNTSCGNNNGALSYFNTFFQSSISTQSYYTVPYSSTSYLYNSVGVYQEISGSSSSATFDSLPPGYYYVKNIDNCGCESTSNSVIILPSTPLDFDLYKLDNAACVNNVGKLIVSGLTGTPPFSYLWTGPVSGQTGTTITGLSNANYSLKITDTFFCSKTVTKVISRTLPITFLTFESTQPSCYANDGSVTLFFQGGVAPYLYQLSNGMSQYSLSNQVTFTGLSSGNYTCTVNDVALCTATASVTILTPQSFTVSNLSSVPATCTKLGSVNVQYVGGTPPFQLTLSGSNYSGSTLSTSLNTYTFNELSPNTYNVTISDSTSACTYSSNIVVENTTNFGIEVYTTGTTCGGYNGALQIEILNSPSSSSTYTYNINETTTSPLTATTYLVQNLKSGSYTISVVDEEMCMKTKTVNISSSIGPQVLLKGTDETNGNSNGTVTAYVHSTEGPFTLNWSQNANGQQGIYLTGLTAGTYTMTLTSSTGCQTIKSYNVKSSINTFTAATYSVKYSTGTKQQTTATPNNLQNMIYNGFKNSIASNNGSNCVLGSATFYIDVVILGTTYEFPFYTTVSLDNVPSFSSFKTTIENAILSIPNIQTCVVNTELSTINIVATSSSGEVYADESVEFVIKISFIINCLSINNVVC
jgi:hypothetical protein